ncbi:MAG: hypothetical protein K8R89_04305 [Anaerolineae bacterium]|nr:hypothetical protein [Anaerolineae bacterium]
MSREKKIALRQARLLSENDSPRELLSSEAMGFFLVSIRRIEIENLSCPEEILLAEWGVKLSAILPVPTDLLRPKNPQDGFGALFSENLAVLWGLSVLAAAVVTSSEFGRAPQGRRCGDIELPV